MDNSATLVFLILYEGETRRDNRAVIALMVLASIVANPFISGAEAKKVAVVETPKSDEEESDDQDMVEESDDDAIMMDGDEEDEQQ